MSGTGRPAPGEPVPPDPDATAGAVSAGATTPSSKARRTPDPETAPWWVTGAQSPLVPAEEEATHLLPAPTAGHGGDEHGTARLLAWIAAGLLAVIILLGLFFLGQRLAGGGAPVAEASPTTEPTPTPTPAPTAAQSPGVHSWDTLFGGECLQPFSSPWDQDFTVVDCSVAHAAQLVYRGTYASTAAEFPGEAALGTQINTLCSASGVVDLAAAAGYSDLVVQGSYPITADQWAANPHYYCFVSRSSGEALEKSIAGPGPTGGPAPAPTPAGTPAPTPAA